MFDPAWLVFLISHSVLAVWVGADALQDAKVIAESVLCLFAL